jgi:hypothetical protein
MSKGEGATADYPTFSSLGDATHTARRRRGRKPKGGKVVSAMASGVDEESKEMSNVVLHIRCSLDDLCPTEPTLDARGASSDLPQQPFETYEGISSAQEPLYHYIDETSRLPPGDRDYKSTEYDTMIVRKLKELETCLHKNEISDKESACFWCTCEFDSPAIYIPSHESGGGYDVYGCFCSPECACAHLMERDRIDSSTKFERYSLLNHLYCDAFNYAHPIRPAPDPHYTLDKFYGNLTIQEYRRSFRNERLLMVVQKPLTRILPELHQDMTDFGSIAGTTSSGGGSGKYRLRRKAVQPDKKSVVSHTFGLT